MKMKGKIGICIIVSIVFIICCFGIHMGISQFISKFFNEKIENKEEAFQFVFENCDKLDKVVHDMNDIYIGHHEEVVIIYKKDIITMTVADNIGELLSNCSVQKIAVNDWEGRMYVKISFDFPPKEYDYWGIYFTQDALPIAWQIGEMEEEDGVYKQKGSYFQYETEQIIDNWYYYQCDTR